MPIPTKTWATAAAALTVIALGAGWIATQAGKPGDAFSACRQGVVSGSGNLGGPFALINDRGQTVTDRDVITKPTLLYFGYSFCPDVCPVDNARNSQAVDILEEMGFDAQPVFVSVDPKRDTPERLHEYAELIHPKMIALTGTKEQIDAASKAYRTYYLIQDSNDDNYLIDHSTQTYLVLPETGYVDFFSRDVDPQEMADRVGCFLEAAAS